MTTALVVLAACCVAAVVLWQRGKRPFAHRDLGPEDIERLQNTLLRRGQDRGYLILEIDDDAAQGHQKFVQFTKYIAEGGRIGLQFDFPLSDWSQPYYRQLQDRLKAQAIHYDIAKTGRADTSEFLTVDFAQDTARARAVALVALDVLAANDPKRKVRGLLHNVNAHDVEVRT